MWRLQPESSVRTQDGGQGHAGARNGSAFHLGAMLESNGKLSAHAWLTARDVVVVGAKGIKGMSYMARFD